MRINPHCFWCGVVVTPIWPEGKKHPPANLATLDHIYDKWQQEKRYEAWKNNDDTRTVLACYLCNQRRNNERQKEISKEAARIRSSLGQERRKLLSTQPRDQVFRGLETIID